MFYSEQFNFESTYINSALIHKLLFVTQSKWRCHIKNEFIDLPDPNFWQKTCSPLPPSLQVWLLRRNVSLSPALPPLSQRSEARDKSERNDTELGVYLQRLRSGSAKAWASAGWWERGIWLWSLSVCWSLSLSPFSVCHCLWVCPLKIEPRASHMQAPNLWAVDLTFFFY